MTSVVLCVDRHRTEQTAQKLAKDTNSFLKQLMYLDGDTPTEKVTINDIVIYCYTCTHLLKGPLYPF